MRIPLFLAGLFCLLSGMAAIIYLEYDLAPFISWVNLIFVLLVTFGIGMAIFSPSLIFSSLKNGISLFFSLKPSLKEKSQKIIQLAALSRSDGLMALEKVPSKDSLLDHGIKLAIQGTPEKNVSAIMNIELKTRIFSLRQSARVLYTLMVLAPLFGFVGTLVALVWENTAVTELPLSGIMLPTLYGFVLSAFFLAPLFFRLKEETHYMQRYGEFSLLGLSAIINGEHPSIVQEKLLAHLTSLPERKNDPVI